eukprot:365139-Chlamydomonas_euryale.AAC.10
MRGHAGACHAGRNVSRCFLVQLARDTSAAASSVIYHAPVYPKGWPADWPIHGNRDVPSSSLSLQSDAAGDSKLTRQH